MTTYYVEDHPERIGKVIVPEPIETVEAKVVTAPQPAPVKTSKAQVK